MPENRWTLHCRAVPAGIILTLLLTGCADNATETIEPTSSTSRSAVSVPAAGWLVTADNVGLRPHGLSCAELPAYSGPRDVLAGTTISRQRITHPLNVSAGSITIELSCMQPTVADPGLPIVATTDYNRLRPATDSVTIRDSEFDGSRLETRTAAQATAFVGVANLSNNYVHGFGSGLALMDTGTQLDVLVEHNYVTGLVAWGDGATNGNHSDAFTIRDFDGSRRAERQATIKNNRFDCNSGNDTGALFIQTFAGRIDNVTVEGNLLEGGGYQLGLNQANHPYGAMRASNNRFSGTGYGPAYVQNGAGWTEWADNYRYDPSAPDGRGVPVDKP